MTQQEMVERFRQRAGRKPRTLRECFGAVKGNCPGYERMMRAYGVAELCGISPRGINAIDREIQWRQDESGRADRDAVAHDRFMYRIRCKAIRRLICQRLVTGQGRLLAWYQDIYMEDFLKNRELPASEINRLPLRRGEYMLTVCLPSHPNEAFVVEALSA